ncbi:MAG: glycosyl transferase [Acetobacteraceae bacterium]|nr:glycosyl transferase [Acetobacteraceae bacterium]
MDRTIIVSGGDAVYYPLIDELRRSIVAASPDPAPAFGVIDGGLTADQAAALIGVGAHVARVPDDPDFPAAVFRRNANVAVNLGKPWLDRMFPGFDTILWLDADTWVQDFAAVRLVHGAAQRGALSVVQGGGRYWERQIDIRWLFGGIGGLGQVRSFFFKNGRHAGLPLAVLRDLGTRSLLNAGVFGLRADAPHWVAMRRWQRRILDRGGKPFSSDQVAMGLAVYQDGLPVELLPDGCNYIRPWRIDLASGKLVEWFYPYPPVGIVHLAGQKEIRFDPTATAEVTDLDGGHHALSLRFGHFHRMVEALRPMPATATNPPAAATV